MLERWHSREREKGLEILRCDYGEAGPWDMGSKVGLEGEIVETCRDSVSRVENRGGNSGVESRGSNSRVEECPSSLSMGLGSRRESGSVSDAAPKASVSIPLETSPPPQEEATP